MTYDHIGAGFRCYFPRFTSCEGHTRFSYHSRGANWCNWCHVDGILGTQFRISAIAGVAGAAEAAGAKLTSFSGKIFFKDSRQGATGVIGVTGAVWAGALHRWMVSRTRSVRTAIVSTGSRTPIDCNGENPLLQHTRPPPPLHPPAPPPPPPPKLNHYFLPLLRATLL